MPKVKITAGTQAAAALIAAICAARSFSEDEIEQLCARLEIDPFQLQELFERALQPAADIPATQESMPPAWYDNNVQLSRLLLELNDLLDFSRADWDRLVSAAELAEPEVAEVFRQAREQLVEATNKYGG